MANRSKMGASIQGCANAAGNPEGWPVPVTNLAGTSLAVTVMGGGGGGPATIADGADVNSGSTTDAAVFGNSSGTLSAKLRGLATILNDVWDDPNSRLNVAVQNTVTVTGTVAATQSGVWTVDTELPAAALLADGTANPTVPAVASFPLFLDAVAGTWNRWISARGIGDGGNGSSQPTIAPYAFNGATFDRLRTANGATATAGTGLLGAGCMAFDGTNYQLMRMENSSNLNVRMSIYQGSIQAAVIQNGADGLVNTAMNSLRTLASGLVFNGSTWDRTRAANSAAATTGTGLLGAGMLGFDGANYQRAQVTTLGDVFTSIRATSNALADAVSNTVQQPVNGGGTAVVYRTFPSVFNGTTWDRPVSSVGATGVPRIASQYAFGRMSTNTTTTHKSGAGILHSIVINTPGLTANTATVYDNTAGSGTVIAVIDTTLVSTPCRIYDVAFATGLTVVTATGTAADLTVCYQ